jgi:hypothetical protein
MLQNEETYVPDQKTEPKKSYEHLKPSEALRRGIALRPKEIANKADYWDDQGGSCVYAALFEGWTGKTGGVNIISGYIYSKFGSNMTLYAGVYKIFTATDETTREDVAKWLESLGW